MALTVGSFLLFTGLVAGLTYYFTRGKDLGTGEGYFLAGRSLTAGVIAGSLLLTNLSAEQLVGLNGNAFGEGLSVMAWEVLAAVSMVLMALVFLPKYLARGVATVPQYLEGSFGPKTRAVTTFLFVVADTFLTLPVILYLGSKGLAGMLNLAGPDGLTGLDRPTVLWGTVIALGVVGSLYAVFGGLRAVAFSDTINGVGLLIGGLLIAYFGLAAVNPNVLEALSEMREARPEMYESLQHDRRAAEPLEDAAKALNDDDHAWAVAGLGEEAPARVGLEEALAYLKATDPKEYAAASAAADPLLPGDTPADALPAARTLRADAPTAYERAERRLLRNPSIPWPTLLSGVLLINLFYWCTNQQIIQRTFAADSLASGQKGVLTAACFKLLAPVVMVLPGLTALHLYGTDPAAGGVTDVDDAYGRLVRQVLPSPLTGFFAAVVFGAVLSSFNSVLNSTATLFSLGVYKAQFKPSATDRETVRVGQIFGAVVAVAAVIGGGLLAGVEGSVFEYLQQMRGLYFIPILAATLVAFNTRRVPDWAAAAAILGGSGIAAVKYFTPGWAIQALRPGWDADVSLSDASDAVLHNFHFVACVFVALVGFLAAVRYFRPRPEPPAPPPSPVDMTPWRFAVPAGVALVLAVVGLYLAFL